MAVLSGARLSGKDAKTRAKRGRTSSRFLCPRPPLIYFARPTKTAMLLGLPNFTAELLKKATSVSYPLLNDFCETEPERENQR